MSHKRSNAADSKRNCQWHWLTGVGYILISGKPDEFSEEVVPAIRVVMVSFTE